MRVDLTKLLYDSKKYPTGKSPRHPDREGAKIFIKKFGMFPKTEAESITFLMNNYLADDENKAKIVLKEMTRGQYRYRVEIPLTSTCFSLVEMQNKDGKTAYCITKFGLD